MERGGGRRYKTKCCECESSGWENVGIFRLGGRRNGWSKKKVRKNLGMDHIRLVGVNVGGNVNYIKDFGKGR